MQPKGIQDILSIVQQPSRYLGSEAGRIKKDPATVRLHLALAFPDLYEIGTSHFGIQILYALLNANPQISAERIFTPAMDMAKQLKKNNLPLTSLENRRPLGAFDIVGFSLLYELNYTNILAMLDLAAIPFLSRERDPSHPLIIGGGPCACNPEPIADFFDAILVGDGEEALPAMTHKWLEWDSDKSGDRLKLLNAWSQIEGVYIPAFFEVKQTTSGIPRIMPRFSHYPRVTRTIVENLDQAPFPEAPVVPFGRPVHDRLRLEIARGCTHSCRFCQAGIIYRPVRERSLEGLLDIARKGLDNTGYEDISLLSLSTGDYSCLDPLMAALMTHYADKHVAISLPSLRAGSISPALLKLIKKVRKTGFTIAPEAGSQRLRNVINKNISQEDIIRSVTNAFGLGWQVVKLYFMIGLPTETDADIDELIKLVESLRKISPSKGRKGKITVSVATFIPKAHTPFQWAAQIPLEEAKEKIAYLKERLRHPMIHFKWQNPEVSAIEGLFARGDRKLSELLIAAHRKGCRFDGWSDHFRFDLWQQALAECGLDADFYTKRNRQLDEPLPWEHIDIRVSNDFLKKEWAKAIAEAPTKDCRHGNCHQCGVCNFKTLRPRVFDNSKTAEIIADETHKKTPKDYKTLQITYHKRDDAKFFGHLEMVNLFLRAIKRAKISIKYSQGFHPKPKFSFENPLPIGIESEEQTCWLTVAACENQKSIKKRLNPFLPQGLVVKTCELAPPKKARHSDINAHRYRICAHEALFDSRRLANFENRQEWPIVHVNAKKRRRRVDLKKAVQLHKMPTADQIELTLSIVPGENIPILVALTEIFDLSREQALCLNVLKLK